MVPTHRPVGLLKGFTTLQCGRWTSSRSSTRLLPTKGTQLLTRTTRKSSLTEAGTTYYQRALNIVDEVSELNAQTSGVKTSLKGTLKVNVPLSFGLMHLTPVFDEFAKQHPDLTLQIDFIDQHIDLITEGYELAIRIADLKDSSLKAKQITTIRHVLCASPDYLNAKGRPEHLIDLAEHNFLQYGPANHSSIQATDNQGKQHNVQLNAKIRSNNGDFLKEMAINGQGIIFSPTFLTYQAMAQGDLVVVLPQYQLPLLQAYAVYPQTRFLSQRCRLLIDFIAERFGDTPYWDQI